MAQLHLAPASLALAAALSAGADHSAQVDKIFERFDSTASPGCAVAVIKDGSVVHKRAYGMANLDHDVVLTPGTIFHVASVSKQFTAFAILLLEDRDKLTLDDEARKYIPELAGIGPRITLRHLVHHTSGLRDQWALLDLAGWRYSLDLITDDDVLALVSRQRDLNFPPGDRYMYSNTGYTLLAQVVKRVSGQSFREFTSANIFGPLGMKSTHFRDDHAEVIKGQAYGYEPAGGGSFRLSVTNFDTAGATSLHTTVEDLALWDRNFYDKRVGAAAVERMLQRGVLANGEQLPYAFGLAVGKYKGLETVDHGGSDAGYRSALLRFPAQRFSVACLCNLSTSNPSALVRQVADIYLEREFQPHAGAAKPEPGASKPVAAAAPFTPSPDQLREYEGAYRSPETDAIVRVAIADGKLVLERWKAKPERMVPRARDEFACGPGSIRFVRDSNGRVSGYLWNSSRILNFRYGRQ